MDLTQVKGDTWVLEGHELIPLYHLGDGRCILLDSGLTSEREELVESLERAGLRPVGVFGSHAHRDHWGNSFYLREKYGARLALPEGEAALCLNPMMYRGAYDTFTPDELVEEYGALIGRVDETVGERDETVVFCGVPFAVLHVPGHSPDQIATATPDGVLYVADALFGAEFLRTAKLPYHYTHAQARRSIEKLRRTSYARYIMAHRAVSDEITLLGAGNLKELDARYARLAALLDRPMTQSEVLAAALRHHRVLARSRGDAARYERNVRTVLEYLVDAHRVAVTLREGVRYYQREER